jgi:WD40 repeat protein
MPPPAVSPDGGRAVILPGAPVDARPVPAPVLIDVAAGKAVALDVRPDREPYVRSAWWSPDGKRLACVHADNGITIWDAATGARRQKLVNRTAGTVVTTAAGLLRFRCDGAGFDTQTTGGPPATGSALFERVLWSSDGAHLLAASAGNYAKLWDVPGEGEPREVALFLQAEGVEVHQLRFSPHGRLVTAPWQSWLHPDANGRPRALLRGWHADGGEEAFRLPHSPTASVGRYAWAPDGRTLATAPAPAAAGEDVKLWDVTDVASGTAPKEMQALAGSGAAAAVAFAPGAFGPALATLDADARTLRVWDVGTPRPVTEVKSPTFVWDPEQFAAGAAPWSPDGRHLWSWTALPSGSGELMPAAWAARGGGEVLAPKPRAVRFALFAWAPDGGRVLTLEEGTARVWDLPRALPVVAGEAAWAPDGERALRLGQPGEPWPSVVRRDGTTVPYMGHNGGPVGAVAWSRDGRRLATAAADRTVKVWDRETGRLLRAIPCPGPDPVWRLAWSKGDKRIVGEATHQGEVRVYAWDADGGPEPVLALAGTMMVVPNVVDWSSPANATHLSADGSTLAAFGLEPLASPGAARPAAKVPSQLRVWDVNSGAVLLEQPGQFSNEYIALAPDGSRMVRSTNLVDVRAKKHLSTLKPFAAGIMAFSPDGTRLAVQSITTPARVVLHDAATGNVVAEGKTTFSVYNRQLRWAPDGKRLLAEPAVSPALWAGAGGGQSFFSVDGSSGEVVAEMKVEPHEQLMLAPQWSPGSDLVIAPVWNSQRKTAGPDAEPPVRLAVWDPASGRRLGTLGGGLNGAAWDLAWSSDGKTIAAAGHDRTVRLWDVAGLKAGADGAAVGAMGVARVLDGHAGDAGPDGPNTSAFFSAVYYGHPGQGPGPVRAAAWRPDGRLVATALRAYRPEDPARRPFGRVHLWDPATGLTRAALYAPALALDWSADGGRLVAFGPADNGRSLRVTVWGVKEGDGLQPAEVGFFDVTWGGAPDPLAARLTVRFDPDGKRLALVGPGLAGVWDAADGRRVLELPPADVRGVEWCPDGARLLVLRDGPDASSVEVRDAGSGNVLRTLRPRLGHFRAAVWSPDGRRVVTASTEKRVSVWDPDSGTELLALPGDAAALAWTRDGRALLGSGPALLRWDGGGYDNP